MRSRRRCGSRLRFSLQICPCALWPVRVRLPISEASKRWAMTKRSWFRVAGCMAALIWASGASADPSTPTSPLSDTPDGAWWESVQREIRAYEQASEQILSARAKIDKQRSQYEGLQNQYSLIESGAFGLLRLNTYTGEVVGCFTSADLWPKVFCGADALAAKEGEKNHPSLWSPSPRGVVNSEVEEMVRLGDEIFKRSAPTANPK